MKPIIKRTLAEKNTRREKIAYLTYAYKEWLIGGLVALVVIGGFIYSVSRPREERYTVAVVSEEGIFGEDQAALTEEMSQWLVQREDVPIEEVQVDFVSDEDPAAVQAFAARLAAGDIVGIVYAANQEEMWLNRFHTQEIPQETIQINGSDYRIQIVKKSKN